MGLIWSAFKDAVAAWWNRSNRSADVAERRQDAADQRQDAAFQQSMQFSDKVLARLDHQDTQIVTLQLQNAEQAAQMNVQRRQIEECQAHHAQCEEDRDRLAAQIAAVNTKVTTIETKLLPEPK